MTCPNADILTRFADATLEDHEATEVVAHLAVCEACSRKVEDLEHRSEQPMMAALRDLKTLRLKPTTRRFPGRLLNTRFSKRSAPAAWVLSIGLCIRI